MEANWRFHHIAVIVKDMDKAVDYYRALGVFTFPPEYMLDSSTYQGYEVYGKKSEGLDKTRMQFVQMGDFRLELVSPVEGEPIYKDFLRDQGEGIHHIAFMVDDLRAETARFAEKGVPVLTYVKRHTGAAGYDGRLREHPAQLTDRLHEPG